MNETGKKEKTKRKGEWIWEKRDGKGYGNKSSNKTSNKNHFFVILTLN